MLARFQSRDHMTLIASCTGYIEFFLSAQVEGNSQRVYTISARQQGHDIGLGLTVHMYMCVDCALPNYLPYFTTPNKYPLQSIIG